MRRLAILVTLVGACGGGTLRVDAGRDAAGSVDARDGARDAADAPAATDTADAPAATDTADAPAATDAADARDAAEATESRWAVCGPPPASCVCPPTPPEQGMPCNCAQPLVCNYGPCGVLVGETAQATCDSGRWRVFRVIDMPCNRDGPPPQCVDGAKDGTELDVDCGGECPPCQFDRTCAHDADCASGRCEPTSGRCAAAASCGNGARDPGETDTDCGGVCPPCARCGACTDFRDCQQFPCTFFQCIGGRCMSVAPIAAACDDGETCSQIICSP